jgi:hypothetical protein
MEKKITRTTLKSFIEKAAGELYVNINHGGFVKAKHLNLNDKSDVSYVTNKRTLGIVGLYLTGGKTSCKDWFYAYEDDTYKGFKYRNCCGSGIIAIRKAA